MSKIEWCERTWNHWLRLDGREDFPNGRPTPPFRIPWFHRKGGDPEEWPEWLRVREMPEVRRG